MKRHRLFAWMMGDEGESTQSIAFSILLATTFLKFGMAMRQPMRFNVAYGHILRTDYSTLRALLEDGLIILTTMF